LYILVFCASAAAWAQSDADALYRERATPGKADAAAEVWEQQLTVNPSDVDAAWKLARAMYWLGTHGPAAAQRASLERGVSAGRLAATLAPARPEGHFWMAANMGALAESFGMRQGLKYRGAIKDALETVLRIDPAFQQGSADRALGRWYHKVPGLFGGSEQKAEQHLRKSLTYNPNSSASHFFLAETLFELGRDRDARDELQKVIDAPLDPEWEPEDRDFKEQARRRLR
jgi:tetratricopeptide (TPR) repeat protein